MNQYLLLRDNKQTGPYSAKQLSEIGLKPYDLVWQEGKSAAWRYPSELEELKSFAPVVEEQPFDRFYKKNASAGIDSEQKDNRTVPGNPNIEENKSVFEPKITSKEETSLPGKKATKIFVTLPNGSNRINKPESVSDHNEGQTQHSYSRKPVKSEAEIHAKFKTVKTSTVPLFPDVSDKKMPEEINSSAKSTGTFQDISGFFSNFKSVGSFEYSKLLKGIVAACLILTGVLIGLFFSNRSQNASSRQLDALVKQIQEKNAGTASSTSKQTQKPLLNTDNFFDQKEVVPEEINSEDFQETEKSITRQAVIKTNLPPADTNESVQNSAGGTSENKIPSTPISLVKEEPVKKNTVPKEVAIKNLFQLVNVAGSEYKTGVLGGISGLKLTITNKSSYQLENVEVEVRYLAPEKRIVRTQIIEFKNVSPGAEMTLPVPKSPRGVSVDYSIKTINSRELGIAYAGLQPNNKAQ